MSVVGQCLLAFIFGSIVGLLVQRSRFCNTAALRDAILFKTYRNTKALLNALRGCRAGGDAAVPAVPAGTAAAGWRRNKPNPSG